jgi:hypothetical protein
MAKLPENLLRPPGEYLHGQIKKVFMQTGFGAIPLWTESGCTIFVHTRSSIIKNSQGSNLSIDLRFEEVDGVPLIWFDLLLVDQDQEQHNVYVFLNILDDQSVSCLQALPYQRWIVIHWYDENREFHSSSAVEWSPVNQKKVKTVTEQARGVIERTGGGDFEEAMNRVKGNVPLS